MSAPSVRTEGIGIGLVIALATAASAVVFGVSSTAFDRIPSAVQRKVCFGDRYKLEARGGRAELRRAPSARRRLHDELLADRLWRIRHADATRRLGHGGDRPERAAAQRLPGNPGG